jgi:hypothetical protein
MTPTVLQTVYHFANHIPAGQQPGDRVPEPWLHRSGALADRFGAGRVFVFGCVLLAAPGPSTTAWPTTRLAVPAVRPDRPAGRHHRRGAVRHGQGVPAGGALQRLSFSYNVAYAIFGGLTPMVVLLLKESPMGPAYYVAVLCGVGIVVGGYLWKKGR